MYVKIHISHTKSLNPHISIRLTTYAHMIYISIQQTIQSSIYKISDIGCAPLLWTVLVRWYANYAYRSITLWHTYNNVSTISYSPLPQNQYVRYSIIGVLFLAGWHGQYGDNNYNQASLVHHGGGFKNHFIFCITLHYI